MTKILIAEDDSILSLYFKSLLIEMGYATVKTVNSGKKAFKSTKIFKPDVIFMDINMEHEKDGIDACLAIKKVDLIVKIVFVSAYPKNIFSDEFDNISYDDYMEKPFKKESIRKCLIKLGF